MDTEAAPSAWQPVTLGGVAAFARATWPRCWLVQAVVAAAVGVSVGWVLTVGWAPVVREAAAHLPEQGAIRDGRLQWPETEPAHLAENSFLSIAADLGALGDLGMTADVQIELAPEQLKLRSLLGYLPITYPRGWIIALNRAEAEPWWGAWRPVVIWGAGAVVALGLLLSWAVLGVLGAVPVRVLAFLADRRATWPACWRVASMALMPAALWMAGAILLYGSQAISLVQLLFAWGVHLGINAVYLLGAPFKLPRLSEGRGANPFALQRPR